MSEGGMWFEKSLEGGFQALFQRKSVMRRTQGIRSEPSKGGETADRFNIQITFEFATRLFKFFGLGLVKYERATSAFLAFLKVCSTPGGWRSYRLWIPSWYAAFASIEFNVGRLRFLRGRRLSGLAPKADLVRLT